MVDADLDSVVAVLVGDARGDHDDRQVLEPCVGAHVAGQIEAIHARHFDVGQHHVGHGFLHLLQRIDAVLGSEHAISGPLQLAAGNFAHGD